MKLETNRSKQQINITDLYLKITSENPDTHVFMDQFGDSGIFIYRSLGRKEYRTIVSSEAISDCDKEEVIYETCTLYPENYDFSNCDEAGLPTALAKRILEQSLLTDAMSLTNLIYHYRNEMNTDYNRQVSCVIHEAFPEFKLDGDDGIENWDVMKTAEYMARAEFILHSLRGVPLAQASIDTGDSNTSGDEQEETRTVSNKDGSQTRVTKKTINSRRSMTPEKLQKLKEIAPNIDWESDLGNAGFDNLSKIMQTKNVDTRPMALRDINGESGQEALPEALRDRFRVID